MGELRQQPECVAAAINLYSKSALTDFESIIKAHFDLLVENRDKKLKHADVEKRLRDLKIEFGALIRRHGFIPNTGQVPSALAKLIKVCHCIITCCKICADVITNNGIMI